MLWKSHRHEICNPRFFSNKANRSAFGFGAFIVVSVLFSVQKVCIFSLWLQKYSFFAKITNAHLFRLRKWILMSNTGGTHYTQSYTDCWRRTKVQFRLTTFWGYGSLTQYMHIFVPILSTIQYKKFPPEMSYKDYLWTKLYHTGNSMCSMYFYVLTVH
jgi:hypothetical protein